MNQTAIIIPARYDSTRLKGKPLLKVKDKTDYPMGLGKSCYGKSCRQNNNRD